MHVSCNGNNELAGTLYDLATDRIYSDLITNAGLRVHH